MRLLLIEDNEKIAEFIIKGLKEKSYAVDYADTGRQGLSMGSSENYDLIILDIMLPDIDGFSITKKLRDAGNKTPILILTAKTKTEEKVYGLDLGADDYLTKPFAMNELLARTRALIRRQTSHSHNILKVADLSVNLSSHEVQRGEQRISLTAKEFSLLEYLMQNKGRVLGRTQIIEHVWDMHFDCDTNIIDVHIRHLRVKIDEAFEPKLIHTIRGAGYVLKEQA